VASVSDEKITIDGLNLTLDVTQLNPALALIHYNWIDSVKILDTSYLRLSLGLRGF